MSKNKATFNLDEKILGTIETLSKQKGLSKSVLVEQMITVGLKDAVVLTAAQRYHFSRCVIENRCLDTLKLAGILVFEGSLSEKILLICALEYDLDKKKHREFRNGIVKLSIFELLEEVKAFDKDVFAKTMHEMSRFRKLRDEYLQLYPNIEKSS